jgi:hypothetical protein
VKFEGFLVKEGKFWIVEIPGLDLMTQGKSRVNALAMAKSVVEDVVGKPSFRVEVEALTKDRFSVSSKDTAELVALMLQRQRAKHGLTLIEVAGRLGSKSSNAFGVYEQGKREPSIGQLEKLLHAIDPKSSLFLKLG